ncbi:MAG TPA: complex I NDUFA9 subunit family protein [Xanthobacteraceae bacterium]|nr:complex I NDUFA9 subunit family protein [Xanthobacteraceae bacterium]
MSAPREVVVFGGTGFLGRRIVRRLLAHGFAVRVASRHPERGAAVFPDPPPALALVRADVGDDASIATVLVGAFAAVNAISLYVERGGRTFRSIHVEAAARVAEHARRCGVARLAHVSGIGADASAESPYIRSRGEGEGAVLAAFAAPTIVRPAVMVGPDDAFLTPLVGLLRRLPAFPMFGSGETALQPAFVEDVAEAIVRAIERPAPERLCELGGPRVFTYRALLQTIAARLGRRRALVPLPFAVWRTLALGAEMLPSPPLTRNQVELMMIDNVASPDRPGFAAFGIAPRGVEATLDAILGAAAAPH